MNNRIVFQAVTQQAIPAGVDVDKCLALITAAYDGDTEEVVHLASDPQVDINFMGENSYQCHSAISAALMNNHTQIVLFLLQLGANVDRPPSGYYLSSDCFQSALSIACTKNFPSDLCLFKPLLRATKNLNHEFSGWDGVGSLIRFITQPRGCVASDNHQRIHLFFHEVLVRGEINNIGEFLRYTQSIEFDDASCQEYLNDIDLTSDQALRAHRALDHLTEIKFISNETCQKIKNTFSEKIKYSLELNEFPIQIQKSLANPANRSLKELFAELQHWLLPDEALPPAIVGGLTVKTTSHYSDDELKKIRYFQDPIRLRQYLKLDPSEFLTMLYDAASPQGENYAAILLACILMFHKNTLLDDEKPLFDLELEKSCFLVLKRLYNLSESE